MIQVSRDAVHTHQGHQDMPLDWLVHDLLLAGRPYSFAATWSEDARPFRGPQYRGVQGAGIPGQSTSSHVTPGSGVPGRDAMAESTQITGWILAARLLHGSQRSKDDNSAAGTHRTTTFGDNGRQLLGLATWSAAGFLRASRLLRFRFELSKCESGKRLIAIDAAGAVAVSYASALMGLELPASKGSVNTTKNDNTQEWQFDSHYRRGSSRRLTDTSGGSRSSIGRQSTALRRPECLHAAGRSAGLLELFRRLPERDSVTVKMVAVCSNERLQSTRQAGDFSGAVSWGVKLD